MQPLVTAPSVWYSDVLRVVDGVWKAQELTPEFLRDLFADDLAKGQALRGRSSTVRWVFHWWLNGVSLGNYDEFTLTTPLSIAVAEIRTGI